MASRRRSDRARKIFQLLREHYQIDFHQFKQASVQRRVLRRALLGAFSGLTSDRRDLVLS
jgi:hypothetical protein